MDLLEGIKRLDAHLKNEKDPDAIRDIRAVISGMSNFYFGLKTDLARERYENYCRGCKYNVPELIPDMMVEDKAIPQLSGRMCSHCGGCNLSYKNRQSVKKCEFWEK